MVHFDRRSFRIGEHKMKPLGLGFEGFVIFKYSLSRVNDNQIHLPLVSLSKYGDAEWAAKRHVYKVR